MADLFAGLTMQEIDALIDVKTVEHNPANAVQLIRELAAEVRRLSELPPKDSPK
jgi:plasmid stabilization system protein ParE